MYDVEQMADMLFSETTSVALYATHRMLRDDRRLFKQAGRLPPMYQPRLQAEVDALRAQEEEAARVWNSVWVTCDVLVCVNVGNGGDCD